MVININMTEKGLTQKEILDKMCKESEKQTMDLLRKLDDIEKKGRDSKLVIGSYNGRL